MGRHFFRERAEISVSRPGRLWAGSAAAAGSNWALVSGNLFERCESLPDHTHSFLIPSLGRRLERPLVQLPSLGVPALRPADVAHLVQGDPLRPEVAGLG